MHIDIYGEKQIMSGNNLVCDRCDFLPLTEAKETWFP